MKTLIVLTAAAAVTGLSGCVAYGDPYAYGSGGYYGTPAPYYGGSVYYGNTVPYGVASPVYIDGSRDHRHRGGAHRDRDGDGVPNRVDRDRDGDGVPNRLDARPNNPRRQ